MAFPFLIYRLCRDAGAPVIPGEDQLIEITRIQDVGLIKNDTNPIAQKHASHPKVVLLELFEGQATAQNDNAAVPDSSAPDMESSKDAMTTSTLLLLYHVCNRRALSPFQPIFCKNWCCDRLRLSLS